MNYRFKRNFTPAPFHLFQYVQVPEGGRRIGREPHGEVARIAHNGTRSAVRSGLSRGRGGSRAGMHPMRAVFRTLVSVFLLSPAAGHAQNLIFNGTFAGGLDGWLYEPSELSYSPLDADGQVNSGSALGELVALGWQYVAVTPNTSYDLGGQLLVVNIGQTGFSTLSVDWFDDVFCSSYISSDLTPSISSSSGPFDTWIRLHARIMSPASAVCAQVSVFLEFGRTHFDNVEFGRSGTVLPVVFDNGFE